MVAIKASRALMNDECLAALVEIYAGEPVVTISLRGCRGVTDRGLPLLLRFPMLRVLDLGHTGVTDAGVATLVGLPALRTLHLDHSRVTPGCLASVQRRTDLVVLGVAG